MTNVGIVELNVNDLSEKFKFSIKKLKITNIIDNFKAFFVHYHLYNNYNYNQFTNDKFTKSIMT